MATPQSRNAAPAATTPPTRNAMNASNAKVLEAARRAPDQRLPEGFIKVSTDRVLYKAGDTAEGLRGEIIGTERVKENGWKKGWTAMDVMIVRLKADSKWTIVAPGGAIEDVEALAGEDVMVILQAGLRRIAQLDEFGELKSGLVKNAFAVGRSPEVFIQPDVKRQLNNGNQMWKWIVGCSPPDTWRPLADVAPEMMGEGFNAALAEAASSGALTGGNVRMPAQLPVASEPVESQA